METCRHHPKQLESLLATSASLQSPSGSPEYAQELSAFVHTAHLTLYKMLNAVNDYRLRLRMMAVLADACISKLFCKIVSISG